ncbi:MAG: chemotaxis protein CheW [Acidimicrobiia bacterium]|nr:chemotaxis protein CheW [Acidimicrobiia bacterium]
MPAETLREFDVLIAEIGDEAYAIPVDRTEAIINYAEPTKTAHPGPYVLGMMDLRGRVVPIVDMAGLLGVAATGDGGKIVVIENAECGVGFRVDGVKEVAALDERELEETPRGLSSSGWIAAVARHKDNLVALLDIDEVLHSVS